jgi:hypothetical protein
VDGAGFEPAASAMPMQRSYQAGLSAHFFAWLLENTVPHLIRISYLLGGFVGGWGWALGVWGIISYCCTVTIAGVLSVGRVAFVICLKG